MSTLFDRIGNYRIVPVVVGVDASTAPALADALVAGGLPIVEITLRTAPAMQAIAWLAKRTDIILGAGTVLTIDQAKQSVDSGAQFLVAPGLDMKIVEWAQQRNVPIVPGVFTATDITHAYNAGLRVLKYFPAESGGGIATIKALAAPFPGVKFMATGGITNDTIRGYLESPLICAVGQSAMVKKEWIEQRQFQKITEATKQAMELVKSVPAKA